MGFGMRLYNALVAACFNANKAAAGLLAPAFALLNILFRWALGTAPAFFVGALRASNLAGTYANGSSGVGATLTVTATGALTIDGVTVTQGMLVLLAAQSTGAQNGLYYCSTAGASGVHPVLTRWGGWDASAEMIAGSVFYIMQGTTYGGTVWAYTGASSPTVGTDALTFAQDSLLRSAVAATVSAVQSFADGTLKLWNSGATFRATLATAATANRTQTTADATGTIPIVTSGTGVIRTGQVTLVAGTATVADAQTTTNTRVILTPYGSPAPGAGDLTVTYVHVSNSAGASFVVRANVAAGTINNLDTSVLNYVAIG